MISEKDPETALQRPLRQNLAFGSFVPFWSHAISSWFSLISCYVSRDPKRHFFSTRLVIQLKNWDTVEKVIREKAELKTFRAVRKPA